MLADDTGVLLHLPRLRCDITAYGLVKTLVSQPVHRVGEGRGETARHLVFALGARLEALQAALQRQFHALVVAGFEVQAVQRFCGAPITPVERVRAGKEHRYGDRRAFQPSQLHDGLPGQRADNFREKCPVQVGLVAAAAEGVSVELVDGIPAGFVKFRAGIGAEGDACFLYPASLALGFFAFVRRESGEEAVIVGEAAVFPQELAGHAVQKASSLEGRHLGGIQKLHVNARNALGTRQCLEGFGGRRAYGGWVASWRH